MSGPNRSAAEWISGPSEVGMVVVTSVDMRRVRSLTQFLAVSLVLLPTLSSAQAPAGDRGPQVFAENKCSACHAVAGKGNAKGALDDVGSRLSAAEIREWITNAPAMAAKAKATRKPPMKAFAQLAAADVDALVAYLQTLRK